MLLLCLFRLVGTLSVVCFALSAEWRIYKTTHKNPRFCKIRKTSGLLVLIVFDEDFADCFRLLFGDSFGDKPGFGFVRLGVSVERVEL